jgi:hypothetical protein
MNRRFACFATTLIAIGMSAALPALADEPASVSRAARPYTLVNRTFDSVTAVAVAPAGDAAFDDIALGEALQGGMTSTAISMPAGDCHRDIRVTFRDKHQQTFPNVDVCRSGGLRLTATGGPRNKTIQADQLSQVDKPGL